VSNINNLKLALINKMNIFRALFHFVQIRIQIGLFVSLFKIIISSKVSVYPYTRQCSENDVFLYNTEGLTHTVCFDWQVTEPLCRWMHTLYVLAHVIQKITFVSCTFVRKTINFILFHQQ